MGVAGVLLGLLGGWIIGAQQGGPGVPAPAPPAQARVAAERAPHAFYFTRGVYAVFPITFVKDFSQGSTMAVPIGP